jgi:hypothetical protein
MKTIKAFVSSTFTDLQTHRQRVINTLRESKLNVDPMENWTATSSDPKVFSRERMEDCDLCLLLVAFRRGYVPEGETLSITQMEYRYAIEHRIPVLVFLLDEAELKWLFDERKTDPEIVRWREELRQKHGIGLFHTDPRSLEVVPAVLRWLQEREPKLTSPFDFTTYLESKRQGFVGREWLFTQIQEWRTKRPEKSLLIVGDPGIGKSAIVAELVRRCPEQVLAYHCCQAEARSTLEPGRIVRALAAQVEESLADVHLEKDALTEANCNSDPITAFTRGLLVPLHLHKSPLGEPGVRYLLFDALDEALARNESGPNLVDLLKFRLNEMPDWVRILATTRRDEDVLEKLHDLNALHLNAQDDQNRDDVRHYVAMQSLLPEVRTLLLEKSESNFLYVRQALEAIKDEKKPLVALRSLPRGLHYLYPVFFTRRFPDKESYRRARRLLQVMVAARDPLSETQLSAAAGLDEEIVLPGVLSQLAQFLVRRQTGDTEVLSLYHKSLVDWLTDKQSRRSHLYISSKKGQIRLADWCWQEYERGPGKMDGYAIRHLPAHLIEMARWDNLAKVLTDLCYLEVKAEEGLVYELANDFASAMQALPADHLWHQRLGLIEEALGLDLLFLRRHPQTLFQTLWNRCWWHDCSEAAKHYRWRPDRGTPAWEQTGPKLSDLMQQWHKRKRVAAPGFRWLRMLRPPRRRLTSPLRVVLAGHQRGLTSAVISPDGKRMASGSWDRTLRLWDVKTGVELRSFVGHTAGVQSVSFSPDSRRLASGSADWTVRLWDVESGVELRILEGHTKKVCSVTFSPNGKQVASGSLDRTVRLWDVETGTELRKLDRLFAGVQSVSFSPNSKHLAASSDDGAVYLLDIESGIEMRIFEGHRAKVTSLSFSPDGKRLASGSFDNTVRLWDVETGKCLRVLGRGIDPVAETNPGPSGWRAVVVESETVIQNISTSQLVSRLSVAPYDLIAHPSGNIWAGDIDNYLCLFTLEGH